MLDKLFAYLAAPHEASGRPGVLTHPIADHPGITRYTFSDSVRALPCALAGGRVPSKAAMVGATSTSLAS